MDSLNAQTDQLKVLVPNSLESQRLYLSDGKVFTIVTNGKFFFKKRVLQEDRTLWESMDEKTLNSIIDVNALKEEANKSLEVLVDSGAMAFDPLVKTVLQELRRKLIESSSGQLKVLFQDFFTRNTKQITEVFAAEKLDGVIKSTGFIPKSTRFRWVMKKGDAKFSIYCLELPPHRRHIRIKKESNNSSYRYNWAMPWLCILAIFKNENFIGLTAFYRSKPLEAEDDSLLKCGLPGKRNRTPWTYCDAGNTPNVQLSDREWVDKLLTWFFDSTFIYHNEYNDYDNECYDIRKTVPEFKSFDEWENFSNGSEAMQSICGINFPAAPMTLNQYVIKIMNHYAGEKVQESPEAVKESEFAAMAERFEQTAREKFVFLVEKTAIDLTTRDKVKALFTESLISLKIRLRRDLGKKLKGLGALIKQNLAYRLETQKEEV